MAEQLDPWAGVFIRHCTRCLMWQPVEEFSALGRLCRACLVSHPYLPVKQIARSRGIAITPLGKADLARWRAEAARQPAESTAA